MEGISLGLRSQDAFASVHPQGNSSSSRYVLLAAAAAMWFGGRAEPKQR